MCGLCLIVKVRHAMAKGIARTRQLTCSASRGVLPCIRNAFTFGFLDCIELCVVILAVI